MVKRLIQIKKDFYKYLDRKARHIAYKLKRKQKVSNLLLRYISELYGCANTETDFSNSRFKSAYHQPITSELEFLIARILHHFSNLNKLGWVINLRKQKKNENTGKLVAPDIKIEKNGEIIAIIEIKAKAGWMQSFFSERREKKLGRSSKKKIKEVRDQLLKYSCLKNCDKNKVFMFLPTFIHVSRKKYDDSIENYRKTFSKNSTLKKDNLIILSNNLSLNLSKHNKKIDYKPTDDFEKFMFKLVSSK